MDSQGVSETTEDLDLVWGSVAIARELNLTERQAFHLLHKKALHPVARKVAGRWCADRPALRNLFRGSVRE